MVALGKSFTSLVVLWMLIFPLLCSFKHAGDKLSLDICVAGGGCPLSGVCAGDGTEPQSCCCYSPAFGLCGFLTPSPPPPSVCSQWHLLLHLSYAQD